MKLLLRPPQYEVRRHGGVFRIVAVSIVLCFILTCLSGCGPEKAVDEALLSCLGKSKEEVCQLLGLNGSEYYEGESAGPYIKENSLQKEFFWCGDKLNTLIGFHKKEEGIVSMVTAVRTFPKNDDTYAYMGQCFNSFKEQFGSPVGVTVVNDGKNGPDHTYIEENTEDYFEEFKNAKETGVLEFRFEKPGANYGDVECAFLRQAGNSGEIRIDFRVRVKDFGNWA